MASSAPAAAAMIGKTARTALIHKRLYRALLRAVKPFTPPSPNAAVLSCLLHRSFIPLEVDETLARRQRDGKREPHSYILDHYMATKYDDFYPEHDEDDADDDDDDVHAHDHDNTNRSSATVDYASSASTPKRYDDHFLLFRRLLWMIFSDGYTYNHKSCRKVVRCYQYPNQVHRQPYKIRDIIRREFRIPESKTTTSGGGVGGSGGYFSGAFPVKARRQCAFLALRKLNEKLAWADQLLLVDDDDDDDQQQQQQLKPPSPKQAAKYVEPILPLTTGRLSDVKDISSYLKPGTFLLAHPHLSGYFRRSVICILQHGSNTTTTTTNENNKDNNEIISNDDDDRHPPSRSKERRSKEEFGTYGIIVNRVSVLETGRNRTVVDVLHILPKELVSVFGSSPMKEGGPVHMPSLQMLHSSTATTTTPSAASASSTISASASVSADNDNDGEQQTHDNGEVDNSQVFALLEEIGGTQLPPVVADRAEEKTVSFRGDIMKAAEAVKAGLLDSDDVSFFAGASCWYPGQLEKEIRQGCWLPCRGPPEIALTGVCEHEPTEGGEPRPKADLWLSMMSACGEDEAKLAHLVERASEDDEYGAACDDF